MPCHSINKNIKIQFLKQSKNTIPPVQFAKKLNITALWVLLSTTTLTWEKKMCQ